ncbi:MAG TPA: sigma factor [Bryobacteraceae bacterium]|jgi:DNA-directed RNA polymerase specialized sigma24 family protein|nr:sigma factor [Bryobacteraceae bacterium]
MESRSHLKSILHRLSVSRADSAATKDYLAAWEDLYRLVRPFVFTIAYRRLGDLDSAQDATQEALLRTVKHFHSPGDLETEKKRWNLIAAEDPDAFHRWLAKVCITTAIDLQRGSNPANSKEGYTIEDASAFGLLPVSSRVEDRVLGSQYASMLPAFFDLLSSLDPSGLSRSIEKLAAAEGCRTLSERFIWMKQFLENSREIRTRRHELLHQLATELGKPASRLYVSLYRLKRKFRQAEAKVFGTHATLGSP